MGYAKFIIGVILELPVVVAILWATMFRFDNPALTETQLFNQVGIVVLCAAIPAFAGGLLIAAGLDDNADD